MLLGEDAQAHPDYVRLTGTVKSESYQGALIRYVIGFADQTIVAEAQNRPDRPIFPIGAEVLVAWHPDTSSILTS